MGSGLTACVRYLLFFFNLIFALTGLAVAVLGGLAQYALAEHSYSHFVADSFRYVPIAMIVVGVVIAVIAFFGCCGSVKESHCMLYIFGVFLVALFVLEIAAGVAGYVFRNDIADQVKTRIDFGVQNYYVDENARKIMDGVQFDLHCCGSQSYNDYSGINKIPLSCCDGVDPTNDAVCDASSAHPRGCYTAIEELMANMSLILLSVGGGIAVIQLIGIVFAFCLARSIKQGYEIV